MAVEDEGMGGQVEEEEEEMETGTQEEDEGENVQEKPFSESFSDSVESDNEDSPWTGSEDEGYNSERLNNRERTGSGDLKEGQIKSEEEDEKLLEDEEDSTDEEEVELPSCKDSNEDKVRVYCKDNYSTGIFQTLTEFRDSSVLTDLDLSTKDGKSFQVHSLVLAAISSNIQELLMGRNVERNEIDADDPRRSISLGLDVDHVGLEAVVEFAYSGLVPHLNKDTVGQIKAVAHRLSVPRVVDLCIEEEEFLNSGRKIREEKISAAEQRTISLKSIKQLWVDRVGCDVVLESIGESLHVHRVVLAASSGYFRGMFTSGMRESQQLHVTLPFLLASELELLVCSSYSGNLPLSWRCVFEVTSTALQLQYQPALSLCLDFLQAEIDPNSCLDLAAFAEAYEMRELLQLADDFVLRQFQKVACTSKFKDLPAKQLFEYLNSRSLCVPSELVVFKAVTAWIQAKPKKRFKLAKDLMKTIHFHLMTFKEFKEVQCLNIWSDRSRMGLYNAILEDFCSNHIAPRSQCRIYLPKESLVLIGGDQISEDLANRGISRELWFGNTLRNHVGFIKDIEWRRLGEMPELARFSHEVAILDGQLYVFGGKKYYGTCDTINSVYRYDPQQNSWGRLADMQQDRCLFSAVVLDGNIYAIGGNCEPEYIDSVERYCPSKNSWRFTRPLDLPLSGHAAKVLKGQIFISGGLNGDYTCLSAMMRYHPETGSTYLANMTQPRAKHCMEALADRLYVAGGITANERNSAINQLACEVYDPVADTWTAVTRLPVPHVGAGSAVLEGKFYVLGGYSQVDYSDTKMVHRYDNATQRWENMGKMPGPNNDIRAAVLCLPQHLRL